MKLFKLSTVKSLHVCFNGLKKEFLAFPSHLFNSYPVYAMNIVNCGGICTCIDQGLKLVQLPPGASMADLHHNLVDPIPRCHQADHHSPHLLRPSKEVEQPR